MVAINPYEELQLYSNDVIQKYKCSNANNLPPHIFSIGTLLFIYFFYIFISIAIDIFMNDR